MNTRYSPFNCYTTLYRWENAKVESQIQTPSKHKIRFRRLRLHQLAEVKSLVATMLCPRVLVPWR